MEVLSGSRAITRLYDVLDGSVCILLSQSIKGTSVNWMTRKSSAAKVNRFAPWLIALNFDHQMFLFSPRASMGLLPALCTSSVMTVLWGSQRAEVPICWQELAVSFSCLLIAASATSKQRRLHWWCSSLWPFCRCKNLAGVFCNSVFAPASSCCATCISITLTFSLLSLVGSSGTWSFSG